MPTTPKEQLLIGVHQLEKAMALVPAGARKAHWLVAIDGVLQTARASDVSEAELRAAQGVLQALATDITPLMRKGR